VNHPVRHYIFVRLVLSIVCLVPRLKNTYTKKEKIPVKSIIRRNLNNKNYNEKINSDFFNTGNR